MARLVLEGSLTIGPPCATECGCGVDGAETTLPVCVKAEATAVVGAITRAISSPGAFLTLSGIGSTDAVSVGAFLYVVTDSPMILRLTCDDGASGTTTQVIDDVQGLFVRQFSVTKALKTLEVKGSGRITYAASGPR